MRRRPSTTQPKRAESFRLSAVSSTATVPATARAGHSDFATTQLYIDLSGEAFREEAQRLEDRLWGDIQYKDQVQRRRLVV